MAKKYTPVDALAYLNRLSFKITIPTQSNHTQDSNGSSDDSVITAPEGIDWGENSAYTEADDSGKLKPHQAKAEHSLFNRSCDYYAAEIAFHEDIKGTAEGLLAICELSMDCPQSSADEYRSIIRSNSNRLDELYEACKCKCAFCSCPEPILNA